MVVLVVGFGVDVAAIVVGFVFGVAVRAALLVLVVLRLLGL